MHLGMLWRFLFTLGSLDIWDFFAQKFSFTDSITCSLKNWNEKGGVSTGEITFLEGASTKKKIFRNAQ